MKKINIYLLLFALGILPAFAQKTDRSKAPKAGPAPKIQLGKYESFTLPNGLTVFVVENHKLPRITFSLTLKTDPVQEGEKAGYVEIAGQMMRRGTATRSKDQIDNEVDFLGASLGASPTGVYGLTLKRHVEKFLGIMSDVVINPSFPADEFEKVKKQTASELVSEKDDPDAMRTNAGRSLVYGKTHPYGEIITEKTLEKITLEQCKNYHQTYYRPNIAYLAVVGDITPAEAKELVTKYFGKWEKGNVPKHTYEAPKLLSAAQVAIVDKPGAVQTVLDITYPVQYKLGDDDYIKARVMNEILGGGGARLFLRLREDKGYTYGAYSQLSQDLLTGSFSASAKVRTEVTDSAVIEFMKELNRIRDEKVSDEELNRVKSVMSGSFARSLENPQTVASFATNIAIYGLPKDYYETYLQKLAAVTADDIQAMAKKYIRPGNAHILAVGDAKAIESKMAQFGKVTRYDNYGFPENTAGLGTVDMTSLQIVEKYLKAIGGREKIAKIKSMKMDAAVEVQPGLKVEISRVVKTPDKLLISQKSPMGEVKQIYNAGKAFSINAGKKEEITGAELERLKRDAINTVTELIHVSKAEQLSAPVLKNVNDRPAYEIEYTIAPGVKSVYYFDKETGLLIKQIGEDGESFLLADYKDVNGILIPHTLKLSGEMAGMDLKVTSLELNPKLSDKLFSGQ